LNNLFNQWKNDATRFLEVRLNIAKLTFVERVSNVLSFIVYLIILLFLGILALIFLGISLQEVFTELLDSRIGGAFATLGFYVLLVIIGVVVRKSITNAFASIFVRIMTAEDDEDSDFEHAKKIKVED
jgi:NAD/NADP transhydrogenase beta subunit